MQKVLRKCQFASVLSTLGIIKNMAKNSRERERVTLSVLLTFCTDNLHRTRGQWQTIQHIIYTGHRIQINTTYNFTKYIQGETQHNHTLRALTHFCSEQTKASITKEYSTRGIGVNFE